MSTELQIKLRNFLINAEEQHITSGSVIYKAIEDNPWVEKDELKDIIKKAISFAKKRSIQGSLRYEILCNILPEDLFSAVNKVSVSELTWKDPLGSQVISDYSDIVQNLSPDSQKSFMKVVPNMVPESLPPIVENRCGEFVRNFVTCGHTQLPQALIHDGKWKESDEKLAEVTSRILETLNNSWNNPAFGPEHAESLNEGTYVTNMIVPAIQASLKNLPYGKNCYISTELNTKLTVEISKLRKKYAKIKAKNIKVEAENTKLKQDKEEVEARFLNLEQRDRKKTDLITKLKHDVLPIKEQSLQNRGNRYTNNISDNAEY
ncbi:12116_t:CDS:2 [Cetraspora pellucida]|uniref:12116_t:CDS:1 n=1 Tax=Cetraspora pellucida TaxID=1433469 RepID=A0A9N9AS41_9GLOM|nr:12116_t:CDS:2 [Cetraspora pellucida]